MKIDAAKAQKTTAAPDNVVKDGAKVETKER